MKEVFEEIIKICEQNNDEEDTLSRIRTEAKNRVIRYEWEEMYGIKLDSSARLAERDFINLSQHETIGYYKDGYASKKDRQGRYIAWPEGGKQPVDEWVYSIGFPSGAYILGDDYDEQKELFTEMFEELRGYKPDYEDLHNNNLFWKVENAKKIMSCFGDILKKYGEKNSDQLNNRKIKKMEKELELLKSK